MPAAKSPSSAADLYVAPARTPAEWADARRLTGELVAWLAETVGLDARAHQHDSNEELDGLARFYAPPQGQLLLGFLGGVPSGTTGVRLMDRDTAELRRVWVTPVARGNGLAPRLLAAAIESARQLGARRIWLETATGHMDKAIAMYTRAGFAPVAPYSSLPETLPGILTLGLDLT